MSFKDNSGLLYADPNAYIQRCECGERKKVVFSEPYETMPNFYLNNNFKRGDCSCNNGKHPLFKDKGCSVYNNFNNEKCHDCADGSCPANQMNNHEQENQPQNNNQNSNSPFSSFNLKSLLPLLGGLSGGGSGLGNIMSMLGGVKEKSNTSSGADLGGILKNLSVNGGLQNLINMFTSSGSNGSGGGLGNLFGLFNKSKQTTNTNNHPKTSDICIKDFKRVE